MTGCCGVIQEVEHGKKRGDGLLCAPSKQADKAGLWLGLFRISGFHFSFFTSLTIISCPDYCTYQIVATYQKYVQDVVVMGIPSCTALGSMFDLVPCRFCPLISLSITTSGTEQIGPHRSTTSYG